MEAIKAAFFQNLKQETTSRPNSPSKQLNQSPKQSLENSVLTTVPLASSMASPTIDASNLAASTAAFNFINDLENTQKRSFTTSINTSGNFSTCFKLFK